LRRKILTIFGLQLLPLLAAEYEFHAEEQEFMAKVERGEVKMGSWGEPCATQTRNPPFDMFTMEWDPEMGFWIMD